MFENIFKRKKCNIEKMSAYGFIRKDEKKVYETTIMDGAFRLYVFVAENGDVDTNLIEIENGEPYVLYKTNATGTFVGEIRAEVEAVLTDIANACYDPAVFKTDQAQMIIEYVRNKYGDELEFLWAKSPDNAIWRRKDSQKWYGVILTVNGRKIGLNTDKMVEIIDLRMKVENREDILSKEHYYPGWHMNKKSWYTIVLDDHVADEEIKLRIDVRMEEPMKTHTLFKEFFIYVALNICGMLGLSCYILADTFFVSNGLGTNGLTALNLAIPIYSFVHGSGLMLGMGGATKYSIFRGQGKDQNADQTFSTVIVITCILAFIFVLLGLFVSKPLTSLLGADREVFHMTNTYLRIILLFAPAFMMNDVFICFVRNDGNPGLSMTAMLIGSFSNIILDYLFIFPLRMGILGAVLATSLAPVISMGILSMHWLKKKNHFHWIKHRISLRLTVNLLSLGIPSLVAEAASGIVMIVFNSILLTICGNTGVAAYGIIANLSLVVISIYTGIAQGTQPITSRAYGSGDNDKIKQTLRYAICSSLFLSAVLYSLFFFGAMPITAAFNSERNLALQQIAVSGLKLYFTAIPFAGINIILSSHFTATEKALPAQVISLSRALFVILPMAFLLSSAFKTTGVWLSYPATEIIVCLVGAVLAIAGKRKLSGKN